jgi:hypothetical protein
MHINLFILGPTMRLWIFCFLLVPLHSFASSADCDETTPPALKPVMAVAAAAQVEPECPNRKKLKNICVMIGEHATDPKNPDKYMYETRLLQAGCVSDSDSEEEKHRKIRETWALFEEDLNCSNIQFDVPRGHLLKYAVSSTFDDFLDDAVKWKVNLNKVDASDKRTVLDYIKVHMEVNKGTAMEQKLKQYYDKLRAAGAKHKSEL